MADNAPNAQAPNAQSQLDIQRIYTKNLSFESPQSPEVFRQEWKPEIKIDLHTHSAPLAQDIHEVILRVTVTAQLDDKTVFLAEVEQAGIFSLLHFAPEQLGPMLGSYCPTILFPYVREVMSDIITRGGFPPFLLSPINFDQLYVQHLQQNQAGQENNLTGVVSETAQ